MAHTLISTHTASASATLDITSGIDGTYPVYEFHYVNMHPATDEVNFIFQVNASGGGGFNETMTTTFFRAYHGEGGGEELLYLTDYDQGQGTAYQPLAYMTGNDGDQSCSGMLTLYDPSSTTFAKHFIARTNDYVGVDAGYSLDDHVAGYINTTSAIDEISFKFSSGNIDAGVIKMFGVS